VGFLFNVRKTVSKSLLQANEYSIFTPVAFKLTAVLYLNSKCMWIKEKCVCKDQGFNWCKNVFWCDEQKLL